ncbi:tetratricopeptide repeat protein [Pontimicrobium aquaticum]|uniref:Tetratricopeptide repeat protein n=1 Tax=Pontimicrobium aquaticum TaxID=2565367 RepID=A0A4U0EYM6_9FLAO|nr:tetratricopeptide repeat protein [Pontimicrobium aquaticum]TJY37155.1 tetratricopeptide repeat protein [Pontimicrobium aquaticum]
MKKFLFLLFPLFGFSQATVIEINQLFKQKQFIKAEQLASAFVDKNPSNLKAIELLGDAYGHQKKWDDAIVQYKKLVETKDDNANYQYKYGGALGMKALEVNKFKALGIIGDVKAAFLRAAELDPEHIDARWALVELYMQLPGIIGGSKKKSLKYAEELEQLSKVDGYLAKGYIYEYDDEPKLAETYYRKAIEIGGSLTCYEKLTNLYETEKKPAKVIATIEEAYEKHNKNHLHYQIGKVSADYNIELDKGARCLKKYIENYTAKDGVPIEWAYFRLAQIHKNKNNKTDALKWVNKALEIRSDFKQAIEEKEKILSL